MNEHNNRLDGDSRKQHSSGDSNRPSSSWYNSLIGWARGHKRKLAVTLGITMIVSVGVGAYLMLHLHEAPLPAGYRIMGIEAGGLQPAEVRAKMNEQVAELEGMTVRFMPDRTDDRLHTISETEFTLKQLGFQFGNEEAMDQLKQWEEGSIATKWNLESQFPGTTLETQIYIDSEQLLRTVRESFGPMIEQKPENAQAVYITPFKVEYKREVSGLELDEYKLEESLQQAVNKYVQNPSQHKELEVRMPLVTIPADMTVSALKARKPNALLGEYTTRIANRGEGHAHNVRASAKALNGIVVSPGQRIRYSDIAKQTEERYGLMSAPVIENGRMTEGIGGGICQTSTTMYNAGLLAGMEVVERIAHSLPVPYAPLGRDATYSKDGPDLILSNKTQGDMVWVTRVEGNKLTVQVYGQQQPGISYEVITEQVSSPVLKINNQVDDSNITPASPEIIVKSFRLKKVNGIVVNKEKLSTSRYRLHSEGIVDEKLRY